MDGNAVNVDGKETCGEKGKWSIEEDLCTLFCCVDERKLI